MRLVDYLDKGASLGPDAPCLTTTDGLSLSYADVVELSHKIAQSLSARGAGPGAKIAILSANDPYAFSCVFGISRAGAIWCPINPRNEAAENSALLSRFDCEVLIYQAAFSELVLAIAPDLPKLQFICLDPPDPGALPEGHIAWEDFLASADGTEIDSDEPDGIAAIVGTGGTTGQPKGVVLAAQNLETMTALTLMGYPFGDRPIYLAIAPLTHAAGVLCLPVMTLGGQILIMRTPDIKAVPELIERHQVTHTFMPPTLIYLMLSAPSLASADLSSLRCFWYGAAPMSVARLTEALTKIGPVMAQIFGQTEAPMMISMMPPQEHFVDNKIGGEIAVDRLASAGRPAPLVTTAIMAADGTLLPTGERGEIVVRSSLVMMGYYKDPEATAEASAHGWHHTGDIGYIDDDGYLFVVDRAKDMIISGGFNVYSTEVEQAVMAHDAVQECAVVGLADDTWGERVVAVIETQPDTEVDAEELKAFVKSRIGSVKTPKEIHIWENLPRSKVGKVVKPEVKAQLTSSAAD